jgi:hypothetical protein
VGSLAAVKTLLDHGAKIDELGTADFSTEKRTPLRIAFDKLGKSKAVAARLATIRHLVERGADRRRAGLEGKIDADGSLHFERVVKLPAEAKDIVVRIEVELVRAHAPPTLLNAGMRTLAKSLAFEIASAPAFGASPLVWTLRVPSVTPDFPSLVIDTLRAANADYVPVTRIAIAPA